MYGRYFIGIGLMSMIMVSCAEEKTQDSQKTDTQSSAVLIPSEASDRGQASIKQSIQVETLVKTTQSWNESPLPNYKPEHPEITALRISIPPHTKLPVHRHPVINAGILLKGSLTVISEAGDTLHMNAGDPIVEMVNQWHHGENNGDDTAEIVVFYSGNVGVPVTILKDSQNEDQSSQNENSEESTVPSH